MGTNFEYLQGVAAFNASETASGKTQTLGGQVSRASSDRKALEKVIKDKQAEIVDLTAQLDQISKKDDVEKFFCGLFGDDCGVGEVTDNLGKGQARLKLAQEELVAKQASVEMSLKELQAAQGDLAQATAARQQSYDEAEGAQLAGL